MQTKVKNLEGFTLVELLLVMAIIGILAGTIALGMSSSRQRARTTATLKLGNNILAETADCYLNNKEISGATNNESGGGTICAGNGTWPALPKQCSYTTYPKINGPYDLVMQCNNEIIICNIQTSRCIKSQAP